jgi:hypothetical protein
VCTLSVSNPSNTESSLIRPQVPTASSIAEAALAGKQRRQCQQLRMTLYAGGQHQQRRSIRESAAQ